MNYNKRKFWIYYNTQRLSNDFTVDEVGWHDSEAGYIFEETRINYIIHFVAKGICHLTVWDAKGEETTYDVCEGEAFVIRAGVRHRYVSDETQPCGRFWLSFAGECSEDMLRRCGISAHTICLKGVPLTEIGKQFRKYYQCITEVTDIVFRLYSISYSVFSILQQMKLGADMPQERLTEKQALITTVVRYVENNLALPLETKEIARQFGYERSYLHRLFKEEKGVSLQQYIRDRRIQWARCLLMETEKSCTKIAAEVGYESYAAFFKVFKEASGSSPEEYRKISRVYASRESATD